ncbi:drebrin-like isoform X2 [Rhineura floridana]|uniref:drebrin-like isoform X2 n=1 Tax=Rhineura floridana TaxID=261503 RepID=UPI002AC7FC8A|nr:drebrin-like isoform X2 [Rhineura floridana]
MGGGINLEKHSLALLAAKGDVVSGRAAASWARSCLAGGERGCSPDYKANVDRRALFAYEKSNALKLLDSGGGGPDELARRFQSGSVMYGLCRVPDAVTGQPHVVLINWVGETVLEQQQQACAGHLPAIRAFFKEAQLVVKASRAEEVTQDGLRHLLSLAAPPGGAATKKMPLGDPQELVGTNYKKTNPALEILRSKRSSFWAQAEREEEERREEERQRAQEERRRWERQRMEEERREAAERERRLQEKGRLIQEQRKQQAQLEAEERRREQARWEQQQQEQEEGLVGRGLLSCSAEKATEAAVLALQRPHNPRAFFHQRERSGSDSGAPELPSPAGGWPGPPRRPFLRYQRSLTESAYIFRRPEPSARPPSGDFQPSASPLLPWLSKPPPLGPTPGARTHPPPIPDRRTPTVPSPPPSPTLLAMGGPSSTSPRAEAAFHALPSLDAPRVGDPPCTPPPELGPPNPFALLEIATSPSSGPEVGAAPSKAGSPLDPCSASPRSSPPHTESPPQPHCHATSTERGPVAQIEEPLQYEAASGSSATGSCSPLASPREAAQPPTSATEPASFCSPELGVLPSPGPGAPKVVAECEPSSTPNGETLPLEKDPVAAAPPPPAPRQADSASYVGHNGIAALEERCWHGEQGAASAEGNLPQESSVDHRTGATAHNGNQGRWAEPQGEGEDPSLLTGEAGAA